MKRLKPQKNKLEFSKWLAYINTLIFVGGTLAAFYICVINSFGADVIFSEIADVYKITLGVFMVKSGVENVSKGIERMKNKKMEVEHYEQRDI